MGAMKEEINNEGISALLKIYVKFHEEAETDETLAGASTLLV